MAAFGCMTAMNYHFGGQVLGPILNIIMFSLNQVRAKGGARLVGVRGGARLVGVRGGARLVGVRQGLCRTLSTPHSLTRSLTITQSLHHPISPSPNLSITPNHP